jgi:hypothetical protein
MTVIDDMVKDLEDRLLTGFSMEEIKIVEKFCDYWLRKGFIAGLEALNKKVGIYLAIHGWKFEDDWSEKRYKEFIENKEVQND